MPRVKGGTVARNRRKKVLKLAKGYYGSKHTLYKTANEQVMRSLRYAYRDRKQRKREFRKLWITRINAACKMHGYSYSRLINGLTNANVEVNRKMLSEIAIHDEKAFAEFVKIAQNNEGKKAVDFVPMDITTLNTYVKPAKKVTAKEEVKKVEAKDNSKNEDLTKFKVAELKEIASAKGIKLPAGIKKSEIIELLQK